MATSGSGCSSSKVREVVLNEDAGAGFIGENGGEYRGLDGVKDAAGWGL